MTVLPVLGGVGVSELVGELVKEGGLPTNGTGEPCKEGGDDWIADVVPLEDSPVGEDRTDGPPPPNENVQVLDAALRKNMTVVINSKSILQMLVDDAASEIHSDAALETLSLGDPPYNQGYLMGHLIPHSHLFKNQQPTLLGKIGLLNCCTTPPSSDTL